MRIPTLLSVLLLSAAAASGAADKVYKWKDADGTVHFTDAPPPKGTEFVDVPVTKSGTTGNGTEKAAKDGDRPASEESKPAAPNAADDARCQQAKSRLTLLESKAELTTMQDGKPTPVSADMRAAETNVARAQVQSYCKAPPTAGGD